MQKALQKESGRGVEGMCRSGPPVTPAVKYVGDLQQSGDNLCSVHFSSADSCLDCVAKVGRTGSL